MRRQRNLNRRPERRTLRYTTRMLDGARRPPPPNYLAIACSALNEVIKLDKRLRPFMDEQSQKLARWLRDQEVRAALRKVYGDAAVEALPSPHQPPGRHRRQVAF